jgi:hypothetical protein
VVQRRFPKGGTQELPQAAHYQTLDSLFARITSHQPAVLLSQNEPATSNQPQPVSSNFLSEQTSTSHQPPANRTGWRLFHLTSLFNQTLDEIVPSIQIRTGWFHLILGVFSHPNTSKIILNYGILNFKSTKIRYLKLFVDTDKVKKCQGMPTTCP